MRISRLSIVAAAVLSLIAWRALADVPPTGATITNTASATYTGPNGQATIQSNTVSTIVAPIGAFTLTEDQNIFANAGSAFVLQHVLTNTGTETLTYDLTDATIAGGFAPTGLELMSDPSGGTTLMPDDQSISSLTLAPGASADILMVGTVPPQTAQQSRATVTISAFALGTTYTNTDTITVVNAAQASTIGFYNSDYTASEIENIPGNPLFMQVDAPSCNTNATAILTTPVTLVSKLTGDTEVFQATETTPGSGVFRVQPSVPTANAASTPVVSGDGIMEVKPNDTVTVSAGAACAGSASAQLLIEPYGVVYDSKTNSPIAAADVTLIDAGTGAAAQVYGADGVTPAPSSVVTGASGSYSFPQVPPGTYEIEVTPPAGHSFPSTLAPASQPAGRNVGVTASYGKPFTISGSANTAINYDIPLDPQAPAGRLFINETVNDPVASIGQFVDYAVTINNNTGVALTGGYVTIALPAGFTYVRGTAVLDGVAIAEPLSTPGLLRFYIGDMSIGQTLILSYRAVLGPDAANGDGIDTAQAFGTSETGLTTSNVSSVQVKLTGGVFSSDAYIIGKIYADCKLDRVQDKGDPGIPGVRIYLDNGDYVVTDEAGKYSFYGLTPRTSVAQVDTTTLPAGVKLEVLDNRNGLNPNSQFVDLQNGDLEKANFAVAGCSAALNRQITARIKALRNPTEISQAASILFSGETAPVSDVVSDPQDSGPVGLPGGTAGADGAASPLLAAPQVGSAMAGEGGLTPVTLPGQAGQGTQGLGASGDQGGSYGNAVPQPIYTPTSSLFDRQTVEDDTTPDAEHDDPDMTMPLEAVLPRLPPGTGFIGLQDGQVLGADQTNVRLEGAAGAELRLSVNGVVVPDSRVGKRSTIAKTGIEGWEYIGVDLHSGRNELTMTALDPFGNARGRATIHVIAPGDLAKIAIKAPAQAVADASTLVPVEISLLDENGNPIPGEAIVTLQSDLGQWQVKSLSHATSGVQTYIENGRGTVMLLPPAHAGEATIDVATGNQEAKQTIAFTPYLRPMIAVGLISGELNLRNLNPEALKPAQTSDIFEREIRTTSASFNGGKDNAAASTQLFLKGKVLGSSLLTLAYDSDKPSDTTLFRDIQPDQYYPVYGDSSARGYEAQSTGALYVLLEHGTSYFLAGDFSTQTSDPARQLSQYSEVLTGVKGHLEGKLGAVGGFASSTSATQVLLTIPANGTSGPFQLNMNGLANSTQVDVVTVDRNQPSVIISDTPLAEYTDYTIEPYSGLLLLNSPVPSVDSNLNPNYIRVTYSVDNGGPKHTVAGGDVKVNITRHLALGASTVDNQDPTNRQVVSGVNATAKLGEQTVAVAELAHSTSSLVGAGNAERVDLDHRGPRVQMHVWGTHTDADFFNLSSVQSEGEAEYGAKGTYRLSQRNQIEIDALRTRDSLTGVKQDGTSVALNHSFDHGVALETGIEQSATNESASLATGMSSALYGSQLPSTLTNTTPVTKAPEVGYTAARVKLTVPVPHVSGASVYVLGEQSVTDAGREVGIGGTDQVNKQTKVYFRYDFINSLNGTYTLTPAVSQYTGIFGVSTAVSSNTQLFNEYREGDAINGREAENAVGLQQLWQFKNGIGITASYQNIRPLYGNVANASNAVTFGSSYTGIPTLRLSGQAQYETSRTSNDVLLTAAAAKKITEAFSLLERALYNTQTSVGTASGARKLVILQTGYAYRPVQTDVWNNLGMLEYKINADSTLGPGLNLDERSIIGTENLNYQPTNYLWLSGRYAFDSARDVTSGVGSTSFLQLAGGRVIYDFSPRWDVGGQAYHVWGDQQGQNALGVEFGYLVWRDIWLSLGYDFVGFNNQDLSGDEYTQQGIYFKFRMKFDQNLFASGP